MANRIVKHTLEIIHLLTDQNPVQVSELSSLLLFFLHH
jgi:ribosomal protein S7